MLRVRRHLFGKRVVDDDDDDDDKQSLIRRNDSK